ncbi:Ger(x)C family germination protein [Scopulibacillus darangshiensis]|uniref:Ger(X)C family germination protein n=1 Tax=Scopulibacillus darangshiensis TaxID=442528 RepID=A0A4R2NGM0_9BACL|nr:hypothetical protein [Scopulibacillus darangshiensis]TCP20305.1 Ger(x)C family germination protein [Scopulibacillus darangshiensis]
MAKKSSCLLILLLLVLMTGCWDQIEIEERGFEIGVAIDLSKDVPELVESGSELAKDNGRFALTDQFVAPGGLGGQSQQQSVGGGQKPFFNITAQGNSMFEATRDMAVKTSRTPYAEQLKVVITSAKAANTPYNVLDLFLRDNEMRRNIKVLISKGRAVDVLNISPKNEKVPSIALDSITNNVDKNTAMVPDIRIGDIHENLLKT